MKNYIIENAKKDSHGYHACVKQSVYAMIKTKDGTEIFGSNKMLNDITICPREIAGCVSGEGYHMCKDICNQIAHAEVDAINNSINSEISIYGATLTLVGHTYCCENCTNTMKKHGIETVIILN
jgi:deoxycytidylate deaminase